MIIRECDVHHGPYNDLVLDGNWPFLYSVHSQNAALGRIDDRRRQQRSIDATVADGKCTALKFFHFQLVVARAAPEVAYGDLEFSEAHTFRIAQYRYYQTFAAPNGYADVIVMVIDNVVPANLGIDCRKEFQRVDATLYKKRHESEFHVVLLLKRFSVFLPQSNHS